MAKFLSDSDFAEIRSTVNDVIETFAQKAIVYHIADKYTLNRFNRDNNNEVTKTDKNLLGLVVWEVNKATLEVEEWGKYDFSVGYVLFGWDYLQNENLIPDQRPLFIPEKDEITIDGIKLEVMGIWTGGQIKDTDAVVKVFFKNNLKNG